MNNKFPSSGSEEGIRITTKPMFADVDIEDSPTDRQERIVGFDQTAINSGAILAVGAGGLAAEQLPGLARKGYGKIITIDPDFVSPSNMPRQFFYPEDLYEGKATSITKNLARECINQTDLTGFDVPYQDGRNLLDLTSISAGLCNVDNNETRIEFARDMLRAKKPCIIAGVSNDANSGYVFVQESVPGKPCFACAFPQKIDDKFHPCPNTPASRDILKVLGGLAMYALDSVHMSRPRSWNLQVVFLDGSLPNTTRNVSVLESCALCGGGSGQRN